MQATAAYFRLEGVLVHRSALASAAWLAARQAAPLARLGRLLAVGASSPLDLLGEPLAATRLAWRALAGCSEDRLVVLAEDLDRLHLRPALRPEGLALIAQCRAQGDRIVVLADHPAQLVASLVEELGADELVANRLVLEDGALTGELEEPVIPGRFDGTWLREHARRHGAEPGRCRAYGATASDATLLSGVGLPCAVLPDRGLRRLARTLAWPVVEEHA